MKALLVLALIAAPALALADDKAAAVALFDEGIKEMKAGNFEKACTAFKKSDELHGDSGTRGSLARCYEKLGKVASAFALWTDLSASAPKALRADAAANAGKLEPRLPKYMLKMSPGAPQVAITINAEAIEAKPGVAVPIDPGKYVLEVNADGYAAWKFEFTAVEGKTEEITIPALKPPQINVKQPPTKEPEPIVEHPAPRSKKRTIGFALLGVGGALAVTGTVFGVIARGRFNDAKDLCGGDIDLCDPTKLKDAQSKVDTARSAGNISTITLAAGGVALVTGIVLIVTSPKPGSSRSVSILPTVGGDSAGVVVSGGF